MMETDTLISVIVPVYNAEKYLDICVGSILSQSYNHFELILVDDGSPDDSSDICDKYAKKDARVRVVHQANGGVSSARNAGIRMAKGSFITFVDSDDYLDTNYLEEMFKHITGSDLSICSLYEVGTTNKIDLVKQCDIRLPKEVISLQKGFVFLIGSGLLNSPCSKLFRKAIIDTNHLYFEEDVQLGEDLLFNLSYLKYCDTISFSEKPLYCYIKINSTLSCQIKPNYADLQLLFYQRIQDLIDELGLEYSQVHRQYSLLNDAIGSVVSGIGNQAEKKAAVVRVLQSSLLNEYLFYSKAHTIREKVFRIILKTQNPEIIYYYFKLISRIRI